MASSTGIPPNEMQRGSPLSRASQAAVAKDIVSVASVADHQFPPTLSTAQQTAQEGRVLASPARRDPTHGDWRPSSAGSVQIPPRRNESEPFLAWTPAITRTRLAVHVLKRVLDLSIGVRPTIDRIAE